MSAPSSSIQQLPGLFITLEGIDGAGKSTHLAQLVQTFRDQGRQVVQTREPGSTALGEQLRELCLQQPMDRQTEALLMFAARREHIVQVIYPALARGDVVISDRYTDATLAYQGYGRVADLAFLQRLARTVQTVEVDGHSIIVAPRLTLWFDIDLNQAAWRLSQTRNPDRFEREQRDFFARVQTGYAALCAQEPQRIHRIHATQSQAAVWQDIAALLRSLQLIA